jgi:uncharacterized membrane protein YidH (DUF202 family)
MSQPRRAANGPTDPEELEDLDEALAAERTLLAWSRTGLSFMGLGGAVIRVAPIPGIAILVLGAVIWLLGRMDSRRTRVAPRERPRVSRLRIISYGTVLVASLAFVVALFVPGRTIG